MSNITDKIDQITEKVASVASAKGAIISALKEKKALINDNATLDEIRESVQLLDCDEPHRYDIKLIDKDGVLVYIPLSAETTTVNGSTISDNKSILTNPPYIVKYPPQVTTLSQSFVRNKYVKKAIIPKGITSLNTEFAYGTYPGFTIVFPSTTNVDLSGTKSFTSETEYLEKFEIYEGNPDYQFEVTTDEYGKTLVTGDTLIGLAGLFDDVTVDLYVSRVKQYVSPRIGTKGQGTLIFNNDVVIENDALNNYKCKSIVFKGNVELNSHALEGMQLETLVFEGETLTTNGQNPFNNVTVDSVVCYTKQVKDVILTLRSDWENKIDYRGADDEDVIEITDIEFYQFDSSHCSARLIYTVNGEPTTDYDFTDKGYTYYDGDNVGEITNEELPIMFNKYDIGREVTIEKDGEEVYSKVFEYEFPVPEIQFVGIDVRPSEWVDGYYDVIFRIKENGEIVDSDYYPINDYGFKYDINGNKGDIFDLVIPAQFQASDFPCMALVLDKDDNIVFDTELHAPN